MSKELEARKTLNKYRNFWYNEIDKEKVEVANALNVILTYPTSEEVCKALSEYLKCNVFFDEDSKEFVATIIEPVVYQYGVTRFIHKVVQIIDINYYPPHLITLIGRFYEGVIENNNRR